MLKAILLLNAFQVDSSNQLRIVRIAEAFAGATNVTMRAVDNGRPPRSLQRSFPFLLLRSLGEVQLSTRELAVTRTKGARFAALSLLKAGKAVADVSFS